MTEPLTVWKYTGLTPGANANTYVLFSTVVALPGAGMLSSAGISRIKLGLEHDQAGTLNSYRSSNRGTTWIQLSTTAVAAPAASTTSEVDFLVDGYADWKLEWVNGGLAQTIFDVVLVGTPQRVVGN